jgi:FMN reductase
MSGPVVLIGGSPSLTSRSSFLAREIETRLEGRGIATWFYSINDFDAEDVLHARGDAPKIAAFLETTKSASAIVLSSPVYKATYAGALKALVDLIPPDALVDKPAVGVGTTRLPAHGAELEKAFGKLFDFFRVRPVGTLVVLDEELALKEGNGALATPAGERLKAVVHALTSALDGRTGGRG